MLKSCCESNVIKDEKLKPRGWTILNATFTKLFTVNLAGCDNDPETYADKFMEILEEFDNISSKLKFNDTMLIFLFHYGLGPPYNAYVQQYAQTHDAFDDDGYPKFTLEYAITRFINTFAGTTKSVTAEAKALAALVNGTFAHTPQSVRALFDAGGCSEYRIQPGAHDGTFAHTPQSVRALIAAGGCSEYKIQPGAHAGNSRTYIVTCKYCNHCKKDWHDDSECTVLHPNLKYEKNRGGCSRSRSWISWQP